MNHSLLTLGELLTMSDDIIKRNAMSILKRLQALSPERANKCRDCGKYIPRAQVTQRFCKACLWRIGYK